jgi:acetamidase/formamidase
MAEHYLDDSLTHNFWDRNFPARLMIDSGDVVVFECGESAGGQVTARTTSSDLFSIDRGRLHALTGPVFVHGAEEGDVLEVEVLELAHKGWGFTYITRGSLLASEFPDPYIHHWEINNLGCVFKSDGAIIVPYQPFCGIMGVAPREDGRLITYLPRDNGGNMDLPGLRVGARVWLPVFALGALFSVGDCHAAQGEGEVCGTAIECPMTVTLRFQVRKDFSLREVQFAAPAIPTGSNVSGYHVTTGHGPDLYANAQTAVRYMIDYLVSTQGLTREEAYVLCSAAVDLKINNIVTPPELMVSAYLPLSIFTR